MGNKNGFSPPNVVNQQSCWDGEGQKSSHDCDGDNTSNQLSQIAHCPQRPAKTARGRWRRDSQWVTLRRPETGSVLSIRDMHSWWVDEFRYPCQWCYYFTVNNRTKQTALNAFMIKRNTNREGECSTQHKSCLIHMRLDHAIALCTRKGFPIDITQFGYRHKGNRRFKRKIWDGAGWRWGGSGVDVAV